MSELPSADLRPAPGPRRGRCPLCGIDYDDLSAELVFREQQEVTRAHLCAMCQSVLIQFFRWMGGDWDQYLELQFRVS